MGPTAIAPTNSVHELLECPVCTNSMYPSIHQLEQMECRANNAEREAELLKEQLDHLKGQLNECLHQKIEVEKKLATSTSQEVASTGSNVLVKNLQQELQHYEFEVREARKLRSNIIVEIDD